MTQLQFFLIWARDWHHGGPWWLGGAVPGGVAFDPAAFCVPAECSTH